MLEEQNTDTPSSSSIKYDDICQIVGHLYLDSFQRTKATETQGNTIMEHLRNQNDALVKEVRELELQLEKRDGV